MDKYEQAVQKLAELIESREHYQKSIGELAYVITEEYGGDMLESLAEDLKETHGLRISATTLKNYLWVYVRIKDLSIPDDFSFRTLQYIASSNDPKYWAERIEKEGLSSAEVYRMVREEKGLEQETLSIKCPHCKKKFEIKRKVAENALNAQSKKA